jgi:hypothetical protein
MPCTPPVATGAGPTGATATRRWYVGAAVRSGLGHPRACAAFAAAALAFGAAGCGGGERRDTSAAAGDYTVDIVRAQFPARQHLAEKPSFVMTVRNTGERTIPNLAVTVYGFSSRSGGARDADPRKPVWLIDREPPGTATAIEDTWAAGAVAPGRDVTLRWELTPVQAGTHKVDYAVAADIDGGSDTRVAGGDRATGAISVRVDSKPAFARVDPRTGRVIRE